ncbi:aspartyl protease family protein [Pedobacter sp. MW01-1-1]|uniref:aspartyl protease family protein n=1 Tax=Pedobacter sp. MW01-1-1 TaxID=3383027 RepID=UPI003FEE0CDC
MLTKYHPFMVLRLVKIWLCCIFLCYDGRAFGQDFTFPGGGNRQSIPFKSIKNLMVVPVYINDKGPYDFVLDTGVGPMIITDPSILDSLDFSVLRKITVTGLGVESVEAYVTQHMRAKVGRSRAQNIPTAILKEDLFNLSGHLGQKVYGLIGYYFFNSFVVDIRYSENRLIFYRPGSKVKYRGSKQKITLENLKPYVQASVKTAEGAIVRAKFLMDTGASHALSLEKLESGPFPLPEKKIKANLGLSLSGQIKGYFGRTEQINLGKYSFRDVISSFPDFESIADKVAVSNRNGNLGADLLRRFDIQFNYQDEFISLKPNQYFKGPFQHDMLGMIIYLDPDKFKAILIGEIEEGSPAEKAGLCPRDQIIGLNFKAIEHYSFSELTELFRSKEGLTLIFEIYRDNEIVFKVAHLEKRI